MTRAVVRTVDERGRLYLGKALAGAKFEVAEQVDGDVLLRRLPEVPVEDWTASPEVQADFAEALEWFKNNPPQRLSKKELEAEERLAALLF